MNVRYGKYHWHVTEPPLWVIPEGWGWDKFSWLRVVPNSYSKTDRTHPAYVLLCNDKWTSRLCHSQKQTAFWMWVATSLAKDNDVAKPTTRISILMVKVGARLASFVRGVLHFDGTMDVVWTQRTVCIGTVIGVGWDWHISEAYLFWRSDVIRLHWMQPSSRETRIVSWVRRDAYVQYFDRGQ